MKRVKRSRAFWANLGVLLLVMAMIITSALLGLHTRSKKAKQAIYSSADLKQNLDEVVLLVDTLANIQGGQPRAGANMAIVRKQLGQALDTVNNQVYSTNKLNTDEKKSLQNMLGQIKNLEDLYDARVTVVGKLLTYIPSLDLGLDLNTQTEVVASRASSAYQGILTVKKSIDFPISDDTQNQMQRSADCFNVLSNQLNSHNLTGANETRNSCYLRYEDMRSHLISDILNVLRSDSAHSTLSDLSALPAKT